MVIIIAALVICIISIIFCHRTAKRKGHKPVLWGMIAVFIGPLAIPLALMLKPRASSYQKDRPLI